MTETTIWFMLLLGFKPPNYVFFGLVIERCFIHLNYLNRFYLILIFLVLKAMQRDFLSHSGAAKDTL